MRIEKDSMGEMSVPEEALYGASTQRAVLNFPISGRGLQDEFVSALGMIKMYAARANQKLGLLEGKKADAIFEAANEVAEGKLNAHFVVDIYQTGSGTSTNMNANEVIANRALELLGEKRGNKKVIHPNDDVNLGQSSNDVFPTAMHISAVLLTTKQLIPALRNLYCALKDKAHEFDPIVKAGRTHLQDATPVRLGQEFAGYAAQIEMSCSMLERALTSVRQLPLGGTAVGTGVNTHPEFAKIVIELLNEKTQERFSEAANHFAAQSSQDSIVEMSGALKTLACTLLKIANDIRWLAAGPRCNLAELRLPEVQPGSSIMPNKVNPVICESVMMVAAQVIGYDATITLANQHGNFELNTMMPVMAYSIIDGIKLLANVTNNFADKCVKGIGANEDRCLEYAEASLANCTALVPFIGYDAAVKVARKASSEGITVREAAKMLGVISEKQLATVMDIKKMTC